MKTIEDYYWEAKDENEARVIDMLLIMYEANGLRNPKKAAGFTICTINMKTWYNIEESTLSDRTLATIDDLVKWACAGFDLREPWEIPPEGYRLVTDEEREEFEKPNVYLYVIKTQREPQWENQGRLVCNDGKWVSHKTYAVPLSYEFKKPWEIPPEGYRLVTDEEREEFKSRDIIGVGVAFDMEHVNDVWAGFARQDWCDTLAYAVPLSYEFKKPEKQITVNGKEYSESTIANALREYVR
jgi:hypothetical protein